MPKRPNTSALLSAGVSCLCVVYVTLFQERAPIRVQQPMPRPADRWENECGTQYIDDMWNGYARSYVRAQRKKEHSECVWNAREGAMANAESAFVVELKATVKARYPSNQLPEKTMPLTTAAVREVEDFWSDRSNGAALMEDLGLGELYPDYMEPLNSHAHWQTQVVARDMMQDLKALVVARERARATVDTSACTMRPENREEVERAFDSVIWRMFTEGEACARMYVGFGNKEVDRMMESIVHGM